MNPRFGIYEVNIPLNGTALSMVAVDRATSLIQPCQWAAERDVLSPQRGEELKVRGENRLFLTLGKISAPLAVRSVPSWVVQTDHPQYCRRSFDEFHRRFIKPTAGVAPF